MQKLESLLTFISAFIYWPIKLSFVVKAEILSLSQLNPKKYIQYKKSSKFRQKKMTVAQREKINKHVSHP